MTVSKEVLDAYQWFLELDYTVKKVQKLGSKWADIVKSNQDKFEIGRSDNGYFKIAHYADFDPDWSNSNWKPEIDGYELVKDFYFGANYYLFKKTDESNKKMNGENKMEYTYKTYAMEDGKQIEVEASINPMAMQAEPFVKLEGTNSKIALYTPGVALAGAADSDIYVVEDTSASTNLINQISRDEAENSNKYPAEAINEYAGVINGKYQLHLVDEHDGVQEVNVNLDGKYEMHQLMNKYFFIKVEHKNDVDLDWL